MKILVAGDYAPMGRVAELLEKNDYASIFDEVKVVTSDVDYAIVNLEAPIVSHKVEAIEKTGPNLKCTDKVIDSIKYAGFECVTLANNHLRDYGEVGVRDTIISCQKESLDYVGAGFDIEEAYAILYKNIKGKTLAVINVCENEWSIATKTRGGSAPLNIVNVSKSIRLAKNQADYVLLVIHGGVEFYSLPTPRMVETYRFFIDMGADAIVNHHQHCYSGYEVYQSKPIFYGLGNFCFDRGSGTAKSWKEGYMVCIDFNDNISFKLIPYIQSDDSAKITLLPSNQFNLAIDSLNRSIQNPESLQDSFTELLEKKKFFFTMLEPYNNNRYINKLRSLHLFPKMIDREFRKKLLGIVNCESHLETLLCLLKREF